MCACFQTPTPRGSIKIFPAADGGITETFPHQRYNAAPVGGRSWRGGEICVTTPSRVLGRLAQSDEPYTPEARLSWHIERALVWLACASADELRLPGDPYEIPDFPLVQNTHFAFAEDSSTLNALVDERPSGRGRRVGSIQPSVRRHACGEAFPIEAGARYPQDSLGRSHPVDSPGAG